MPFVQYDLAPSHMDWTNEDVVIHYSGTQSGDLVFTDSGKQDLTITSTSGHQIRDTISVVRIDRLIPAVPIWHIEGVKPI